jgi:hypothetical protein
MGVQNIKYKNQDNLQEKFQKLSMDYAKRKWIYDHYRVGQEVEKDRWMNAYLMQETLCNTNCEIVDYIWMKVNGFLNNCYDDIQPIDINVIKMEYAVYNINNYITEQVKWSEAQW